MDEHAYQQKVMQSMTISDYPIIELHGSLDICRFPLTYFQIHQYQLIPMNTAYWAGGFELVGGSEVRLRTGKETGPLKGNSLPFRLVLFFIQPF